MAHIDRAKIDVSCSPDECDRIYRGLVELNRQLGDSGIYVMNVSTFDKKSMLSITYSTKKAHRKIEKLLHRPKPIIGQDDLSTEVRHSSLGPLSQLESEKRKQ